MNSCARVVSTRSTLTPRCRSSLLPACCSSTRPIPRIRLLQPTVGRGTTERTNHARGHHRSVGCGGQTGPISGRRESVGPLEARRERPDTAQTDGHTYICHRIVGVTQQGRGTFEPTRLQIGMRRFTESTRESAAEMRTRQHRGRSHLIDGQFAGVLRVDQIFGAEQIPRRGKATHVATIARFDYPTERSLSLQYCLRSAFLSGLPKAVNGRASATMICFGD